MRMRHRTRERVRVMMRMRHRARERVRSAMGEGVRVTMRMRVVMRMRMRIQGRVADGVEQLFAVIGSNVVVDAISAGTSVIVAIPGGDPSGLSLQLSNQ